MSIKIEIPGDYLEIFFVANGECMWKYGRILQFLVANATILVAMYSVVSIADIANAWSFTTDYIQKVTPVLDIAFPKESGKK